LQNLITYLEKEDEAGRKRGRWIKRIDVDFHSFERDWHEYRKTNGARPKVIDSWDYIITPDLTPNITVLDVSSKNGGLVQVHIKPFFQAIGKLENLRRVEWRVGGTELSDLRELSIHCPRLEHIAFQLYGSPVNENFTISFPHVESMILDLTNRLSSFFQTSWQSWNLPKLRHFGFHTKYQDEWSGFIQDILYSSKEYVKSLDLVGRGENYLFTVSTDLVCFFPNLETLFFDASKFFYTIKDPSVLPSSRNVSLHTIGWRIDGRRSWDGIEELVLKQFNPRTFPNISTILSLENLDSRIRPVVLDSRFVI
jgi:hypothetical protein